MGRWRQPGADELLLVFLLLATIGSALSWLSHIHGQENLLGRAAASEACSALAEGYPLHWLTAAQNAPLIFKEALLRDWTQWVLISMSVLYLGWVWLRPRADSSEEGVVTTINDLAAAD